MALQKLSPQRLDTSTGIILTPANTPSGPVAGQIYYDSTDNQVQFYNGSAWGSMGGVEGIIDNSNATAITIGSDESVTLAGNLIVNGTTTTINTANLTVDDRNIELGSVTSPTDGTADGGGIILKGLTDKTILWDNTNDNWTSNQSWNLATGNVFKINNTTVLSATTLQYLDATSSIQTQIDSATLTSGIADTNNVIVDSTSVADDEYARFTASGLESRSVSEVLSDIGAQASLTNGIADTNNVIVNSASVADDEYARFTASGLESRSTSEVLSDIGAAGTASPTFTGTISTSGLGIILTPASTPPSPAEGQIYYDSTIDQVQFYDGTAWGSMAGSAGTTAVANGALSDGDTVVVNSNGTVSKIGWNSDPAVGSATVFESATISSTWNSRLSITYDTNAQKVVVVYEDAGNSNYGTAAVGTVSGTTITFGTPVVFESATTVSPTITYDANAQKVVIAYKDGGNSNYGTAIVGTVSGTSISFGTAVVFESATTERPYAVYDTNAQKVVISYIDEGNFGKGTAIVGTVSGTSISFGTPAVYTASNYYGTITYDANAQKVVIAYRDLMNSNYLTAIVGTVSGTGISFGTPAVFYSSNTQTNPVVSYDTTAQKVVFAWTDQQNDGMARVGTISGTSISFGTEVEFTGNNIHHISITYDASAQGVVIVYNDQSGPAFDKPVAIPGTISGTDISFGATIIAGSGNAQLISTTYDTSTNKIVSAYRDNGNSQYGTAVVYQTNSNNFLTGNFLGISDGAYADTATATIQVSGSIDDAQSGLTVGSRYYVQSTGTLSTTPDTSRSIYAGIALSATKLLQLNVINDGTLSNTTQDNITRLGIVTSGTLNGPSFLQQTTTTIEGTISEQKLVMADTVTLSNNLTVNDRLVLSQMQDDKYGLDNHVKLLIHSDTTDGSTTFTDSGRLGTHTITANGNVHHEVDQYKFGATSMYFDGTGDYLSIPASADFDLMADTNDWTIDFWLYSTTELSSGSTAFIGIGGEGDANADGWNIGYYQSGFQPTISGMSGASGTSSWAWSDQMLYVTTFSANTWYHLTWVRSSGIFYGFIDGVKVFEVSGETNAIVSAPTSTLEIGRNKYGNRYFTGYLDEIRITKGVARWTENFTVPYKAYQDSTPALLTGAYTITGSGTIENGLIDSTDQWEGSTYINTLGTVLKGKLTSGVTGSPALNLSNATIFPAGHVIQTQSYFTNSNSITTVCAANQYSDLGTFQVSITPISASSKILVRMWMGAFNFSSTNYGIAGTGVFRRKIGSGSFTTIAEGSGNATWNGTFHLAQANSYQYNSGISPIFLDSPNTTSECTYGIAVADHNNGTQTFYLNQLGSTGNNSYSPYYASSLIVQEIAG